SGARPSAWMTAARWTCPGGPERSSSILRSTRSRRWRPGPPPIATAHGESTHAMPTNPDGCRPCRRGRYARLLGRRAKVPDPRTVREAPPDAQAPARRVTLDGSRLAPQRVGGPAEGGRGGQADFHPGRQRRGAAGRLLNGRARGEPWARLLERR